MRPTLAACVLLIALIANGSDARAAKQVLPPESSRSILRALQPHALDQPVAPGWVLSEVKVEQDFAELVLTGERPAKLVLVAREAELPNPSTTLGDTASFRVGLVTGGRPGDALTAAANALFTALRSADKGGFYRTIEGDKRPTPGAQSSDQAPTPEPSVPVTWTLLFGWGLGMVLLARALRRDAVSLGASLRTDLAIGFGISAAAAALRASLSPMTLLHENTRGPRDLEAIAELAPLLRPMGGTQGVQRLLAQVGLEPTVQTWAGTNLIWSSLTVGAVYGLLRALRVDRLPSVAGAMTLATLPLAIRFSGCEDAFPGSVFHLALGVLTAAIAARSGRASWFGLSAVLLALAGVFRPSQYAAAGVFLPWAIAMAEPERRANLLRPRTLALVGLAWAAIVLPDVSAMLSERSGSSALTVGWWSRPGIHSWPLVDPEVSPVWWMPLSALGFGLAARHRETRAAAVGLLLYGVAMSFLLSCDYGWPSSLRRALTQAWVPAALIGLGLGTLGPGRPRNLIAGGLIVLSLSTLGTHSSWVQTRFGQQQEVDAQQARVLPHLLAERPGTIVTPWPTLDELSGTLLTVPLRRAGWEVLPMDRADEAIANRDPQRPLYWYRSVACWARKVRGGRAEPGLHPACEALERRARWRPALLFEISTESDSDSLVLGEPGDRIELGLFRVEDP